MFPLRNKLGLAKASPFFSESQLQPQEEFMGLDQYASTYLSDGYIENDVFYWRKHSQLQAFMQEKWDRLNSEKEASEFNVSPLRLTKEDILDLKRRLVFGIMPRSEGGFFFGHQWQDQTSEEYKEQDLKFCEWALKKIDEGLPVYYQCWW